MLFLVVKNSGYGNIEIGLIEAESREVLSATLTEQAHPPDLMGVAFTFEIAPVGQYATIPRR